ncbi:MAG: DUF4342 domain-containing protein [Firmicutes bacterium]|nr:DUF4342 domain-containing protein [Bacillota bacterium]
MATIEQVEKLREKANVTYDEAKKALDACGGDLLDAIIYLERQGKVKPPPGGGYYNSQTQRETTEEPTGRQEQKNRQNGETFASLVRKFLKWVGRLIVKGNQNTFEVRHDGKVVIAIPVTILVVLLLLAFWVVVPLLIIGLFLNCRYVFKGPDIEKSGVNEVMGSAADAADNLKKSIFED